ncbi:MAG: hypothetical protein O3B70_00835 [Bacteroidetes bacterium]|nr:hypothetical protein [Bacteroidota bacterium]MDA0902858.1 hypothetical protein [Bacteroidota bacterium]MDA1241989.1 hypothetical protein [Bacteroidota bacterium]
MKNLGLLSWLSRKKLSDEQVANIFVNTSFETVEKGWPQVAAFLNAAPELDSCPNLDPEDYGRFLMVVVSANLGLIPKHFPPGVDRAIIQRCCAKFGLALGLPPETFAKKVKEFRSFMKEINRPSKNTLTAMTRAVCYKYGVIAHQEPYFRDMNVPNPILQKNLREVMEHFVWDWGEFVGQYKVVKTMEEEA